MKYKLYIKYFNMWFVLSYGVSYPFIMDYASRRLNELSSDLIGIKVMAFFYLMWVITTIFGIKRKEEKHENTKYC